GSLGSHLDAGFGDGLEKAGPQTKPGRDVRSVQTGPVTMHSAGVGFLGPIVAAEVATTAGVEIPLHGVAFPEMAVIGVVGGVAVKGAQRGIKGLVVPHIKELTGAVAQAGVGVLFVRIVR